MDVLSTMGTIPFEISLPKFFSEKFYYYDK